MAGSTYTIEKYSTGLRGGRDGKPESKHSGGGVSDNPEETQYWVGKTAYLITIIVIADGKSRVSRNILRVRAGN